MKLTGGVPEEEQPVVPHLHPAVAEPLQVGVDGGKLPPDSLVVDHCPDGGAQLLLRVKVAVVHHIIQSIFALIAFCVAISDKLEDLGDNINIPLLALQGCITQEEEALWGIGQGGLVLPDSAVLWSC